METDAWISLNSEALLRDLDGHTMRDHRDPLYLAKNPKSTEETLKTLIPRPCP